MDRRRAVCWTNVFTWGITYLWFWTRFQSVWPLSDSLIFIVFRTGSEWNDQILAKLHLERILGSKIDTIGPERSLELNLIISDGLQHFGLFKILENQILKLNPGPVRRSLLCSLLDYTYRARWPEGLLCLNNSTDCLKLKNLNCANFKKPNCAQFSFLSLHNSNPGCDFPTWNMHAKKSKITLFSHLSTPRQTNGQDSHIFSLDPTYISRTQ